MSKVKGEFSGGSGMIQPEQVGHEDDIQELWEIYATNPASTQADGQVLAENVQRGTMPWTTPVVDINSRPQTVGQGGTLGEFE